MRALFVTLIVFSLALSQHAIAADDFDDDAPAESYESGLVAQDPSPDAAEETPEDEGPFAGYAQVNTGSGTLNMRQFAKDGAKVVAKLPNRSVVKVLELGEEWSKVSFKNKIGYVLTTYLEETEPPSMPDGPESGGFPTGYAKVNTGAGTLNMRKQAKDGAKPVAKLPNSTVVQVLEYGDEWCKVSFRNKAGYVVTTYLEAAEPPAEDPEPEEGPPSEPNGDQAGLEGTPTDGLSGTENNTHAFLFAKVNTGKGTLSMRRQAKDGAKPVAKLPNGAIVQVLQIGEKWSKVSFGKKTGYAMNSYLTAQLDLPYTPLSPGDKGEGVIALKKRMKELGYLKSNQVHERYDADMEKAVRKLELLNGLQETGVATPELQMFIFHGQAAKSKSGYTAAMTDKASGLTVSILAWTSGYIPMGGDDHGSVEVHVHYVTQASGGSGPYTTTVRRTDKSGGGTGGDPVKSPFKLIWRRGVNAVYLNVTVTDEEGNCVTAQVRVGIQSQPDFDGAID